MSATKLAAKLEALLALRDKAALATTVPFQPADACWSIAEYCGDDEDLVANSMSFNVAKFFSEVSNQSPDLLRQAAARLRSMEEALKQLVDDLDVYHEATGKLESVVSEEAWSAARAALSKEAVT